MSLDRVPEARRETLRRYREGLRISQEEMAAKLGVVESSVRNFEQNRTSRPRFYDKYVAILRAARAERLGFADPATLADAVKVSPAVADRILAGEPVHEDAGGYVDIVLDVEEARYREAAKKAAGDEHRITEEEQAADRAQLLGGGPEVGADEAAARGDRDDVSGFAKDA